MNYQILFSRQMKKIIINLSSSKLAQRMIKNKSQKADSDISFKLSTVCMKCQILFSRKNKNNMSSKKQIKFLFFRLSVLHRSILLFKQHFNDKRFYK